MISAASGEAAGDFGAQPARLTAFVRGRVQGVGFRWWVRARALELGLVGHGTNLDDGRVEVVAEGARADCELLLALLREAPSAPRRPGQVSGVSHLWTTARGDLAGFFER